MLIGFVVRPRKRHVQAEMAFQTHGGKRKGAGRPRKGPKGGKPNAPHDKRPAHDARHPVHVTLRIVADITSLRRRDTYHALREATLTAAQREDFRIVHMSIQRDHIYLTPALAAAAGSIFFKVSAICRRMAASLSRKSSSSPAAIG